MERERVTPLQSSCLLVYLNEITVSTNVVGIQGCHVPPLRWVFLHPTPKLEVHGLQLFKYFVYILRLPYMGWTQNTDKEMAYSSSCKLRSCWLD
jgi:hypothetical protein